MASKKTAKAAKKAAKKPAITPASNSGLFALKVNNPRTAKRETIALVGDSGGCPAMQRAYQIKKAMWAEFHVLVYIERVSGK